MLKWNIYFRPLNSFLVLTFGPHEPEGHYAKAKSQNLGDILLASDNKFLKLISIMILFSLGILRDYQLQISELKRTRSWQFDDLFWVANVDPGIQFL